MNEGLVLKGEIVKFSPEQRLSRYDNGVEKMYHLAESMGSLLAHYDGSVGNSLSPVRDDILRNTENALELSSGDRAQSLLKMAEIEVRSLRWGLQIIDPYIEATSPQDLGRTLRNVGNRVLQVFDRPVGHDRVSGYSFFKGQEDDEMVRRLIRPYLGGLRLLMLSNDFVGIGDEMIQDSAYLQRESARLVRQFQLGRVVEAQGRINEVSEEIVEMSDQRLGDTGDVLNIIGVIGNAGVDLSKLQESLEAVQVRGSNTAEISRLQAIRYNESKKAIAEMQTLIAGVSTGVRADVLARVAGQTQNVSSLCFMVGQLAIDRAVMDQANMAIARLVEAGQVIVSDLSIRQ